MYVIARAVCRYICSTYYAKCFCIRIHDIIAIIFFPMAAVNLRNWSGEIVYLQPLQNDIRKGRPPSMSEVAFLVACILLPFAEIRFAFQKLLEIWNEGALFIFGQLCNSLTRQVNLKCINFFVFRRRKFKNEKRSTNNEFSAFTYKTTLGMAQTTCISSYIQF